MLDDLILDRAGLRRLLESERAFDVVGEASSGTEAIHLSCLLRPDILITDTLTACAGTASVIPAILRVSPGTHVLAIARRSAANCIALNPAGRKTAIDDCVSDCLQLALRDGALGLLRRDIEPRELFEAVRAVHAGRAWCDGNTVARVLQHVHGEERADGWNRMSIRDHEVAELISEGHSNKEIAHALEIGVPTVKKHVSRLLAALGLQDRLQLGLRLARDPLMLGAPRIRTNRD